MEFKSACWRLRGSGRIWVVEVGASCEDLSTVYKREVMAHRITLLRRSATRGSFELKYFCNTRKRSSILFGTATVSYAQVCRMGPLSSGSEAYFRMNVNVRQHGFERIKSVCCLVQRGDNLPGDTIPRGSARGRLISRTFPYRWYSRSTPPPRVDAIKRVSSYMITRGFFRRYLFQRLNNNFLFAAILSIQGS